MVATPTYNPVRIYLVNSHRVIIGSSLGRGGASIISGAGGLKPNAVAGGPSVSLKEKNQLSDK